jgi:PhnB protein
MPKVRPIPKGHQIVTPGLAVQGAAAFIAFCKKAFGAKEITRMLGPGGMVMHAELEIGGSKIMVGEEMPGMGNKSAKTLAGCPVSFYIYTEDCDAAYKKAVKAGCTGLMPPTDMFWGDRYGRLDDPFGHTWAVATHIEDVSPAEMKKRAKAFAKQMEAGAASAAPAAEQ